MNLNIKINTKKLKKISAWILDHINIISIILSILVVVYFGIFLYFNFYQTIISAQKIIVLQADVSPAKINLDLLDQVEATYEEKLKIKTYNWSDFNNFFSSPQSGNNPATDNSPRPKTNF